MANPFQGLNRRLSRKAFVEELQAVAEQCRRAIEAQTSGFDPDPAAAAERRERVRGGDMTFFCQTYFPHYATDDVSALHEWLDRELAERAGTGMRVACAAPRGNAKSTRVAAMYVLWRVITGTMHYGILVMDTWEQAAAGIEAIKAELESNPRLAGDWPEAVGPGRVWREGVILTATGIKLEAAGATKRIRGRRHGPYRPDLLVLDDIENDENVKTPEQRDKLFERIMKSFLQLGPPDGSMDVIWVGTVLHYDSALARVLDRGVTWLRKTFQAVAKWPDRMDLWEAWEEHLRNDRLADAEALYAENEVAMNAGAEVLWPSVQPLRYLMAKRIEIGPDAFDSEYQNDPVSLSDAPLAGIQIWVQPARDWIFFGACDPSLGKHGRRGDPAAILVGGYSRERGVLDVVDARIARMKPSLIIETVIAMHQLWDTRVFAIESVQFQEFFRQRLVEVSAERGVHVPARPINTISDKTLRIQSLQPHIDNELIRIGANQRELMTQLRRWPKADHDDGPDALEMLWVTARKFARALNTHITLPDRAAPLGLHDLHEDYP